MLQEHLINQVHGTIHVEGKHSIMKVKRKVPSESVEVIEDRYIDC